MRCFRFFDGCQKAGHFLLAQHNRQLVSPTAGRNVVFDCPASLEGDGVEKAQGRDCDTDRTDCEAFVVGEKKQIRSDLGGPETFR